MFLLLTFIVLAPRLFFAAADNDAGGTRILRRQSPVDLSHFASHVEPGLEPRTSSASFPAAGNGNPLSPEEIRQAFDAYVHSAPLPQLPLLEPPLNKPAKATASGKVAVAPAGASLRPSNPAPEKEKRGFRHSFSGPQAADVAAVVPAGNSRRFRARLFDDMVLAGEAPVQLQVLESFVINGCEVKKNTVVTALAKRSGNRVELELTSLQACGELHACAFSAYGGDGQRGLYLQGGSAGAEKGAEVAAASVKREAWQAANGVLSAYGGAAGRIVGSGLSDVVNGSGQYDNSIRLAEGTKVTFKAD